ncbi:MAG: phosphoribosyltransferase [Luteolibacter sp.]
MLASKLKNIMPIANPLIWALPRGGVPVAAEIAQSMKIPMELLVVRKIGAPKNPEFALGAISLDNTLVLDQEKIAGNQVDPNQLEQIIDAERNELARRQTAYHCPITFPDLQSSTAIIVDDGIATGATISAAIAVLKKQKAARIIVAAPVASADSARKIRSEADELITIIEPTQMFAVGQFYENFEPVSDDEVLKIIGPFQQKNRP